MKQPQTFEDLVKSRFVVLGGQIEFTEEEQEIILQLLEKVRASTISECQSIAKT
jgi:hypothetical protein